MPLRDYLLELAVAVPDFGNSRGSFVEGRAHRVFHSAQTTAQSIGYVRMPLEYSGADVYATMLRLST